jgi:hypothetical protein
MPIHTLVIRAEREIRIREPNHNYNIISFLLVLYQCVVADPFI